jgi:hypothetical protein
MADIHQTADILRRQHKLPDHEDAIATLSRALVDRDGVAVFDASEFNTFVTRISAAGKQVYYKPSAPTAEARGAALITACAAALAGDHVVTGAGTFALGSSRLLVPNNVHLTGAGMNLTRITSTYAISALPNGLGIVSPGQSSQIADLHIEGVAADGVFQAPIGTDGRVVSGIRLERVRMTADTDGIFLQQGATSLVAVDCEINTKYDAIRVDFGGPHAVDLHHCRLTVTGPSATGAKPARVMAIDQGTVRMFGGFMSASLSNNNDNGCIYLFGGNVELHNVRATTIGTGFDLKREGGNLYVTGGSGSGTNGNYTTSGTITYRNAQTS